MNFSNFNSRICQRGSLTILALAILALSPAPAAGAITPQTATVLSLTAGYGTIQIKGNVDPGEADAKWWAETSTDNENWSGYPGVFGEFPANAGPQPVEVEISNEQGDPEKFLKGSTRYYVRLVVSDGVTNTFSFAPNQFATTLAVDPPKVLSVNDATAVTYTTAKISGSVERPANPAPAFNARCRIEYVLDSQFVLTGFKTATPVACVPNPVTASGSSPVSADLTGLRPGATYHYRAVAVNAGGSDTLEAPNTFTTTAISPPAVTISAPTLGVGTSVHFSEQSIPNSARPHRASMKSTGASNAHRNASIQTANCSPGRRFPDNSQHTVSDVVLEHNTEYRVKLVATNAGTSATAGPVSVTTPPAAPVARTLGVSAGSYSANLGAKINPLNSPVTYRFEWGPTGSYGSQAPAIPEQLSRADNVFHFVTAPLAELTPGETYHYRVIATNTQTDEESEGADRTFTTLPAPVPPPACLNDDSRVGASASLPDCRAYEYVTPGLNGAAPAGWPEISVEGVRSDGGAIAFVNGGAPEVAEGSTVTNTVLAQRGLAGWLTKSLSAPTPVGSGTYFGTSRSTVGLSSDLSESVLWTNQPLVGGASPSGTNLYLRRADGSFVALTKAGAPKFSDGGELSGASQDFTHLFIVSTVKQRPADPVNGGNTYEWANGDLKLVTILPGPGKEPAPNGGTLPQGALPAVSDNGAEALFKAGGLPGLYLRSDGENTVQVSVSKRSTPDPNPVAPAIAVGIAADGSKVLFTSRSELTDNANTGRTLGASNDQGNDIYSYDVGTGALTDLTVANDPADLAAGADVEKVVGASRDASYVYFIARGNLAEGATSGERNLYVEHEGTIDFIGTNPTGSTLQGYPFYVTPDGRHAAFMSAEARPATTTPAKTRSTSTPTAARSNADLAGRAESRRSAAPRSSGGRSATTAAGSSSRATTPSSHRRRAGFPTSSSTWTALFVC